MATTSNDGSSNGGDPIEEEVQKIWKEHPGIGVKDLMEKLESRPPPESGDITKQRVKAAKEAIPYRYCRNEERSTDDESSEQSLDLDEERIEFVRQKIQERQSLRKERRFKESDRISRGLEAMGVQLDDAHKTWTVVKKKRTAAEAPPLQNGVGVPCGTCGLYFASRNLVFKHLRDPASGCGNRLFVSGQSLPDAPSQVVKREKKEEGFRRRSTKKKTLSIDQHACLWFGDLPLPWTRHGGKYKRLRALLREYLPRTVPQPWIQKVVRKSYRDYRNDRAHLGFAIVVFRDADEAQLVLERMNGLQINAGVVFRSTRGELSCNPDSNKEETDALLELPSFPLKVCRHVQWGGRTASSSPTETENSSTATGKQPHQQRPGKDPSLTEQLRPLTTGQLRERILGWKMLHGDCTEAQINGNIGPEEDEEKESASNENGNGELSDFKQHEKFLGQLIALYSIHDPRTIIRRRGQPIPKEIRTRLLSILESLRWPAQNERPALVSERYLVLRTNASVSQRFYSDLSETCADLMQWADPGYTYSAIAVTKNFVSSPHVDEQDRSFQYAVSLGGFDAGGGELCVEGYSVNEDNAWSGDESLDERHVNVVDTHNRIARVDGRHVHWVRTWEGGDRYSLIYYETREQYWTPLIRAGVDEDFLQECG